MKNTIGKIAAIIICVAITILGASIFIEIGTQGAITRLLTIRADDKYQIPAPYKMRYLPGINKYVIEKTDKCCEYRFMDYGFGRVYFFTIDDATKFSDSSRCKGALKKYVAERTLAP